jgi:hypothetical protein
VIRPTFVGINGRVCEPYGIRPTDRFPAGAWLITADGSELRVEPDGTVFLRPSPLPWSRPSAAAVPHLPRRR